MNAHEKAPLISNLVAAMQGMSREKEMITLLVEGQETAVRSTRSVFLAVEKANDASTADLLTQRMQIHEKTAWMLRSLLEH